MLDNLREGWMSRYELLNIFSDFAGFVAAREPLGVGMWLTIISSEILSLVFIVVSLWLFNRFEV
jgi:hypothetical protein